jgi:predicted GNAT family acetyltransferase
MHTTFLLLKVLRTKRDAKKIKSIHPYIKRRAHNQGLNAVSTDKPIEEAETKR